MIKAATVKKYDLEKDIQDRGFTLDFDGDIRTTYIRSQWSLSIHWDGDIIDPEGTPDGFSIWNLMKSKKEYVGTRPKSPEELDILLKEVGFTS